jgi:hypothetical protein
VMRKEKCLHVAVVRIIIKLIFVIVPCSLIFVCYPTIHYVSVYGPSIYYLCTFFL